MPHGSGQDQSLPKDRLWAGPALREYSSMQGKRLWSVAIRGFLILGNQALVTTGLPKEAKSRDQSCDRTTV